MYIKKDKKQLVRINKERFSLENRENIYLNP